MRSLSLTYEDPQQRPHDHHHHEHHGGGDEGEVRYAQQTGPQPLESLGLPSSLPVLPADPLQSVVNCGHLHGHICDLRLWGRETALTQMQSAITVAVNCTCPLDANRGVVNHAEMI